MAITYGFYNSLNGDRKYNAEQISSLFDGIIGDGVHQSIGDRFMVRASGGMEITVGTGRAWFNHTWTLNDTLIPMTVPAAHTILNRIDAVVLRINTSKDVRANSIRYITGTASSSPSAPTLTNDGSIFEYALAYIRVNANVTNITQAVITNRVGTSGTPYVTGLVQIMSIDQITAQWQSQWDQWLASKPTEYERMATSSLARLDMYFTEEQQALEDFKKTYEKDLLDAYNIYKDLVDEYQSEFDAYKQATKDELDEFVGNYEIELNRWKANFTSQFNSWFANLQAVLDGDVAAHLQNEIDNIVATGSIITITTDDSELYGTDVQLDGMDTHMSSKFDNTGTAKFNGVLGVGTLDVIAKNGEIDMNVEVPYFGNYIFPLTEFSATINIQLKNPDTFGGNIKVVGPALNTLLRSDQDGRASLTVRLPGTYSFTVTNE